MIGSAAQATLTPAITPFAPAAGRRPVELDPCSDQRWTWLLQRYRSDVFHSPRWLRIIGDTYAVEARALLLLDEGGQPAAGLPFFRFDDPLGVRIVSLPFSDFCDPLVSDPAQWAALLDHLCAEGCPVGLRALHNELALADQRLEVVKQARWHGLALDTDLDTLWGGLHPSSRRAIRKAQQDGVLVRPAASLEDLHAFFMLHLKVRKHKYRLLAQPYQFFEQIWQRFLLPGAGSLLLATQGDTIIGGTMYLEWGDTLYYKFNASDPADLQHRPNDLLTWAGIQLARSRGLARLDFGLSDWDQEGLIRYKRKFASEEKAISFLRYLPAGSLSSPAQQQLRSALGRLTELFTDPTVPDEITNQAGASLYRFFA